MTTGTVALGRLLVSHWQSAWALDATTVACALAYLAAVARQGRWPARRSACFLAGLGVLVVALQSGIGAYDDRLLSAHMLQHMLLALVAPLLLAQGRPELLALRSLSGARRRRLARALATAGRLASAPAALALFSSTIVLVHLPAVYELAIATPPLHDVEHLLFVAVGLVFWMPLLDAPPLGSGRLGGLGRIVYLLAAMPAMALVGAYLNRAAAPVYRSYVSPARVLGVSPVVDQQQAGAIMWVGASSFLIAVGLWAVMASMAAEERRQQARERHATLAESGEAVLR